ncbi:Orn/Lys/Arg family decarboxylase, partial [Paenibacillus graminis]|nr:amino acid decarboxylase [Paenibacillus graminis]
LQGASGGVGSAAATSTPPQGMAAYSTQDPFKAVIYDAAGVLRGFELQRRLEEKGMVPEMSDDRHVVLAFSLGSKAEDTQRLLAALREIAEETSGGLANLPGGTAKQKSSTEYLHTEPGKGQVQASVKYSTWNNLMDDFISRPVLFSMKPVNPVETERIRLEYSAGRTAAEMVIPYPPGIPLVYPGEWISEDICSRLVSLRQGGAKFQACADPALQHIQVYNIKKGGDV